MFTRCSTCRTVFHITAAELRAADGTVICGACGATFDALESLSEAQPKSPSTDAAKLPPVDPVDPVDGATPALDEHARDEDEFLEELESLIGGDGLLDDEGSSEIPTEDDPAESFNDEEAFLIEDFDEQTASPPSDFDASSIDWHAADPVMPGAEAAEDSPVFEILPDDRPDEGFGDEELDDDIPDPDSVFRVDDLDDEFSDSALPYLGDEEQPSPQDDPSSDEPRDEAAGAADTAGGGVHTASQDAAIAPPAASEPVPEFAQASRGGRTWLRISLALIALLVLVGTWAHSQHGKLLRHPAGQTVLSPIYSVLGMEVVPSWNPSEFRAVQWEAIADADQPDDLIVAVDFINMASYAQPYPVIRIVLEDRFGRRVGTHDIPPGGYLQTHSSGNRLPAGGRVRTTVTVRDPGARADGFRVDFCLEVHAGGLVCGPAPFR